MDSIAQKVQEFRRNVTPAVKCFMPYRTFNRYKGVFEYHNCGHCPYCLSLRANELASRCFNECKQHKYSLFFTLTYDNEHIPYLEHLGKWYVLRNRLAKVDGYCTPIVHESQFDIDKSKVIESNLYPIDREVFGVIWLKDIQDFQKRLRINIQRKLNHYGYSEDTENSCSLYQHRLKQLSIRLFINPEYGPTTLRPHYHGILWTDSKQVADLCLDEFRGRKEASDPYQWHGFIYKSWKMCSPERCDVQHVVKSAPNYVSQYVAGTFDLPSVLRSKPFRPKPLASKNPVIGSYKVDFETIKDAFFNGTVEFSKYDEREKTFVVLPLPYSIILRFFPKCQAFSVQDAFSKLLLYKKYKFGRYVRRKVILRGVYDKRKGDMVTFDENLDHVDDIFTDYFRYQNQRFARMIDFWSSRPFNFPVRSSDGCLLRYETLQLTPLQVIRKFEQFYSKLELYQLRNMYLEQSCILGENISYHNTGSFGSVLFPSVYQQRLYVLSYYPELVHRLPNTLSTHSDYKKLLPILDSFGLIPSDLYYGNKLVSSQVDFIKHNVIFDNFVKTCFQKINDKSKSKKFKEVYARKKGIIY